MYFVDWRKKKVENDENNNNKKQRKEDNVRMVKLNETKEHSKEDEAAEQ